MEELQAGSVICFQYCIISIVCTVSLIYFIVATDRSAEHSSELFFYKLTIGFTALCAFTDVFFALREFGSVRLGSFFSFGSEILYSLGSIIGAYCWFVYSEKKQHSRVSSSPKALKILAIPFVIMSALTVSTPFHGLCFYFNGSQYVRGILNIPFTAVCSAFVVCSGISALIASFNKKHHSGATLLRLLAMYSVFLVLAQVLQIVIGPIMPFRSFAATIVFMFITIRGMCETVTVDALSGINNRFSFDRELDMKISGNEKFWLIMLDIDDFKQINDTYGHTVGDEAIRYTAAAITRAIPHEFRAARYGGDEFAVIAPYVDEREIIGLEEKINGELLRTVRENNYPFTLELSAGHASRSDDINNIPDMVELADTMLYVRKRVKKAGNHEK